jgi:hypothetical protein
VSNGNWMSGAVKHPGALHKALGVPQGQKIPASKLAAAAHSSNPLTRKRAVLAQTFKKTAGKRARGASTNGAGTGSKKPNAANKQDPSGY